jgi:hypothetical protein
MKRWVLLSLLLIPVAASAQVRFSAKFVCGRPTATETGSLAVAPGTYFTAINIHNLSTNATAGLRKRFSFGLISERPGRMSNFISASIPAGQTILIDCREILGSVGGPPFAEGVAEILSNVDIDVIGVYTTVGASGQVTTMEIDRVPRR